MEDNVKKQPEKNFIKVRGTATFYEGNAFEFVSQKEGKPQRTDVKKYGNAKVYTTTGASPKKVITIECSADTVELETQTGTGGDEKVVKTLTPVSDWTVKMLVL